MSDQRFFNHARYIRDAALTVADCVVAEDLKTAAARLHLLENLTKELRHRIASYETRTKQHEDGERLVSNQCNDSDLCKLENMASTIVMNSKLDAREAVNRVLGLKLISRSPSGEQVEHLVQRVIYRTSWLG